MRRGSRLPLSAPIEVDDFEKRYRGGARVRIESLRLLGRLVLIEGGNGTGKTTLLRAMGGLIRYRGRIAGLARTLYIGEGASLPALFSVEGYLDCLLSIYGDASQERKETLLALFELKHIRRRRIFQLSKGQRQKLALAGGLLAGGGTLLLDEPFSGLDDGSKRRLAAYLHLDARRVLIATHEEWPLTHESPSRVRL